MKKRHIALAVLGVAAAAALITAASRTVSEKQQLNREIPYNVLSAEDFTPVLRFAVASDIHIGVGDDARNPRLGQLFDTAYAFADASSTYKGLDAVVLVGDITDSGKQEEYDILNGIINSHIRADTKLIPVMGNHDLGNTGAEGYLANLGKTLDVHEVISGFHFIGLSPQPSDTWHTPSQILWMAKELRKTEKDDPNKPIFTFQHGHIWKTVYVSRSWYTQMSAPLHAVYSQYPQVVNFSGHSHGPVNNPLEVWQSRYTLFGAGTLKYFEMERDISDNTVPAGSENAAQYLIVEVDANNYVRVMPYNLLTNDFFKTPTRTDNSETQLIFGVNIPRGRKDFAYTAARKKTATAPWFPADATIAVKYKSTDAVTLAFDQADDFECVYGYRIKICAAEKPNKVITTKEIYSEYYFEPMPQALTVTVDGLTLGGNYIANVIPLNVWLMEGEPLSIEFTL